MKRAILAIAIGLIVSGCSWPGLIPEGEESDPLAVNDALRQACPSLSDAEIRAVLVDCNVARLSGETLLDARRVLVTSCWGGECYTCGMAIIDRVHSQAE